MDDLLEADFSPGIVSGSRANRNWETEIFV